MFSFFGDSEHRVFNYKPIYYNPEEEERKRRFGRVDGSLGNTASGRCRHSGNRVPARKQERDCNCQDETHPHDASTTRKQSF